MRQLLKKRSRITGMFSREKPPGSGPTLRQLSESAKAIAMTPQLDESIWRGTCGIHTLGQADAHVVWRAWVRGVLGLLGGVGEMDG